MIFEAQFSNFSYTSGEELSFSKEIVFYSSSCVFLFNAASASLAGFLLFDLFFIGYFYNQQFIL